MDFYFSAGVIGWHEFMGLNETNWMSGSFLSSTEKVFMSSPSQARWV